MMAQYRALKEKYKDALLLFRVGDFYEMFLEDAVKGSGILDIALTRRGKEAGEDIPLAGIPYHALDQYLPKLVRAGLRVAVCEQVEDPKLAKGLVSRDVVRVISPGLVTEEQMLEPTVENRIALLACSARGYGLAVADVSTGSLEVVEFDPAAATPAEVLERVALELSLADPRELLVDTECAYSEIELLRAFPSEARPFVQRREVDPDPARAREALGRTFGSTFALDGFGVSALEASLVACAALFDHLRENKFSPETRFDRIAPRHAGREMVLDPATRAALEITERISGAARGGTLLSVLQKTVTAPGARILRERLERPLREVAAIEARLDRVERLHGGFELEARVETLLRRAGDLPRLLARLDRESPSPRDLLRVAQTLETGLALVSLLRGEPLFAPRDLAIPEIEALATTLRTAVREADLPSDVRDGNVIDEAFDPEIARLRGIARNARGAILEFERRERESTGIRTLKVRHNRVFGFFIEISATQAKNAPPHYARRQTLANAERFATEELASFESDVQSAEERALEIEIRIFRDLVARTLAQAKSLRAFALWMATLDADRALARVARDAHYVRPVLDESRDLEIRDGRHPVVEQQPGIAFVRNDVHFTDDHTLFLITGPNMAGKSTFIRQVALVALMAQAGSFVPARAARIGVVDRIFARVGAQDDIALGRSTFMVEMVETANILHNATQRSLVVLDEIGRGTSTYDGLAIARTVAEWLAARAPAGHGEPPHGRASRCGGARTLFATHYHEMVTLSSEFENVRNLTVAVSESAEGIVFLRKIIAGAADRSYGIHVAALAGLPRVAIERAEHLLAQLEASGNTAPAAAAAGSSGTFRVFETDPTPVQLTLFGLDSNPAIDALLKLRPESMTPLEALNRIAELHNLAANHEKSHRR